MKLKKLLALTLAGAVLTASLTACTPLDAAKLVYDSIFGGGSSSTGGTGSGNNGSTGGNTGGTTGSGSTAEEAVNSDVAEAYVKSLQKEGTDTSETYKEIKPVYDIPYLEEFVKAIDHYCTEKSKMDNKSWEDTVNDLSTQELNSLAQVLVRHGENYGSSSATLQFWKDPSGTPEQQVQQMNSYARTCGSFWDTTQQYPYHGKAWFDSVVLTRTENGSKYRFLLSICHN